MNDDFNPVYKNPYMDMEIVNHLRAQRHDFMNDIQVIWGYLQLGKPEEAGKYIEGMNRHMDLYSRIFRLGNPALSLFLYDHILKAEKMGLTIDFSSDLSKVNNEAFTSGYLEKLDLLDCLFNRVVEGSSRGGSTIYIDIYCEDDDLYLVFANNTDVTDMDFSGGCCAGMSKEAREILDAAGRAGIKSMCSIDGANVTAAVCFEYKEDD